MIERVVEDTKVFLARNEGDRERLEAQLSPETLALLESKVELARWYPIGWYAELSELLWREEGGGRVEYLRQRGVDSMRRLMEGGVYQQLAYVRRAAGRKRKSASRRSLLRGARLIGSITGSIRNFGQDTWEWDPDHPGILLHHTRDAKHYPETLRFTGEGAETFLVRASWPDAPEVTSARVTPDHIVFTSDYSGVIDPRE